MNESNAPPVCASKRLVAIASISSMKIIAGEFSIESKDNENDFRNQKRFASVPLARRNTSRTIRGPSPRYF